MYFLIKRKERKRREGIEGRIEEKRRVQKMPFDAMDIFASIIPTFLSNIQVLIENQ